MRCMPEFITLPFSEVTAQAVTSFRTRLINARSRIEILIDSSCFPRPAESANSFVSRFVSSNDLSAIWRICNFSRDFGSGPRIVAYANAARKLIPTLEKREGACTGNPRCYRVRRTQRERKLTHVRQSPRTLRCIWALENGDIWRIVTG